MRRIVHLSDLHFGREDSAAVEQLGHIVNELSPHVVVVSGDLTQRARTAEFRAAKAFLESLPAPQVIVPGNHDVPLYNPVDRFLWPLTKFHRYITDEATPAFVDDEIAVVGVSTARSLTIKGGRINMDQVAGLRSHFCALPEHLLKMVVTHHPFDLPAKAGHGSVVGRAGAALPRLTECGADVFLAGHMHTSSVMPSAKRYEIPGGRNALLVQAGTAVSERSRGEAQSFNILQADGPTLAVRTMSFVKGTFRETETKRYRQGPAGWEREA
jgi:3',5'-cyclic AMP phosphodiesterase CpdA